MLQSLLLILFVLGALQTIAWFKRQPADKRKKMIWRFGLGVLFIFLLLMVATGRAHWFLAVIGALLPFLRGLLGVALQLLPWWLKRKQPTSEETHQQHSHTPNSPPATTMELQEAMDILGLKGDITKREITAELVNATHRRLIQKMHPDRGGSDYLAAKINRARDLLLKALGE